MKISTVLGIATLALGRNSVYSVECAITSSIQHLMNVDGGVARKTQIYRDIITGLENMGYHPSGGWLSYSRMHKMREDNMMFLTLAKQLALEQGL